MSIKFPQSEIIPAKNDLGALGNRINLETRSLHDKIDKLMTLKFAIAVRDPKVYRQGIQMFYHIFNTIEICLNREMERNTRYSEMLKSIYKPAMLRTANLYQDLMFFYGDRPEKFSSPVLPKQIEFTQHILKVTQDKPYLLLAYMHVMYLALFAGGRIMSSKVAKSLRLFPQIEGKSFDDIQLMGTNFFKFEVEDMETLRIIYKRDYELQTRNFLTEQEKLDVIKESQFIFSTNSECVKEIETHNLERIKGKLSYQLVTKGFNALVIFIMLLIMWFGAKFARQYLQ
ncbi:hypothetical protein CANARDRAFT_28095 [[Candida] arabinofermentans NRRL YB-2248]|uniref:Heme oxygenase n=1 Tax=[Candida] arabinofermentans NRRL YB-2248 TaxID=983967 RepID=A0A1E4T2S0_9ASCO|nr:hypothetical protein CANARDRAFT_28095 [[Candida] arabinofermentans NRRL YB-2248]